MKQIVVKVRDCEGSTAPTRADLSTIADSRDRADCASSHGPDVPGNMTLEMNLSDDQATRLLETLMQFSCDSGGDASGSVISELVDRELRRSDGQTSGLYEKVISNVERRLLERVFDACDRVQTRTADRLGMDRNTLHKKLVRCNVLDVSNGEQ